MDKDALEQENRREIYKFILKYPGLHLREISRKMNIPKSTMIYHLHYLKKRNLIVTKSESGYSRYYISYEIGRKNKVVLNILRQETPRRIILYLLRFPNSSKKDISYYLKKHRTTVTFHLNKLIEMNIVDIIPDDYESVYKIKMNNELYEILKFLILFNKKIFDNKVDAILNYLEEIHKKEYHQTHEIEVFC